MAKHRVTPFYPPLIDNERFNRNGMVPHASLMKRLADSFNWAACRGKKQVLMKCQDLAATEAGIATVVWPGFFRTGENTDRLRVVLGIAMADFSISSDPYVQLVVRDVATSTIVLNPEWPFKAENGDVNVAPNEISYVHALTDAVLDPNTEYRYQFELANGARLVFASITECGSEYADDTVTGCCDSGQFTAEAPIYDGHIGDLRNANNELWQHNGAHLVSWVARYTEDEHPVVDWTTYTNVLDMTNTSVGANTPGWNLQTQYHNTANRTTVPVRFAVKTDRTLGTGTLDIKLTDGTNSIGFTALADVNGWSVMSGTIPAQAATKWDLQAKVSAGGTEFRVMGASLYEWES